ncbi:MAG TPA: PAS domain S-box protein [Gaiellaceae bacterium]|nr:PAS domain S-box protein [Gaiellaceae bacterium]
MRQARDPAVAERSGWRSRRFGPLSRHASAYASIIGLAALVAAVAAVVSTDPTRTEWISFALLLPLAALAPRFRVAVGRNHSFHTGPAFIVAGALALPPALVLGLVLALHLPVWSRDDHPPWYIQAFNLSNYTLSALGAWAVADTAGPGDASFALAGLLAAVVFVAVNHALLAIMLRLGRGHTFRESGLFSATGFGIELVLALLGVAIGAFVEFNPWLLPALIAPLALGHRTLSTVALLRESEERFRTMFESAPTATMLIGVDGTVRAANRSLQALLGYTEEELRQASPADLVHPDDRANGAEEYAALVRGDYDAYRREALFVTKEGRTVVTHLAAALVRDADEKPNYVIGMAEDVTEQKVLEDQLRQSQKLEAIGRLAGGVAHDFNNMLTVIGGYTAFALDHSADGSPLRSDLEEIRKATERASQLTRQLLAFSRKQVLKPELLDLNEIVVELHSMLQPMIGEDIVMSLALDPALGRTEADPGQLHQVVLNLMVNARDAMPAGGSLSIVTANADVPEEFGDGSIAPGRYVTLTVRDAGEGIDEETLSQIFEPFFTTKDTDKGTGLGLSTVYGIVKQSGGYIVVESEVGVGSEFTIYMVRADVARGHAPEPVVAPTPVPQDTAGKTVLVVEDEDVVRGLVRTVLEGVGFTVLVARNGEEAFALAAKHHVDVLLSDLAMPKLGGQEVVERLRASYPELKVVYMSGYAESGIFSDGVLPPGTAFLEKPFTFSELTEAVQKVLPG